MVGGWGLRGSAISVTTAVLFLWCLRELGFSLSIFPSLSFSIITSLSFSLVTFRASLERVTATQEEGLLSVDDFAFLKINQ